MNRPPYLMRIRISGPGRKINLWLPLFIILPVAAAILLILAPLVLLAAAVLWRLGWGRPLLIAFPAVIDCFYAMRGLEVEVRQRQEIVIISVK